MRNALPETYLLYNDLLFEHQRKQVDSILEEIYVNKQRYSTDLLWEVDQEIGGIGGYCMPCDPKKNPYPGGQYRELFRPLQYARTEIEVSNIHLHSKYVVMNSGLHLEAVARLGLAHFKLLGSIRYMNSTLGKAVRVLSSVNVIPQYIIDGLFQFVNLYNKSKHEVNQDNDRERLFMPDDAIVCYLAARVIGFEVLSILGHESTGYIYKIDKTIFEGI